MIKANEILGIRLTTLHNIYFLTHLMQDMRKAILEDRFVEFREAFYQKYSL